MDFGQKKTKRMRIIIDGRFWGESGIGRYIRNLVFEIGKLPTDNEYYILLLKKDLKVELPEKFQKVEADFKWYGFSEQVRLPRLLSELKPDLVHFPHFNVPIFYKGKFVVTIHDLIHQHFQTREASTRNSLFYQVKKFGYARAFAFAINKSVKIIVPSETVKDQLEKEWKVEKKKIVVTYEGVGQGFVEIARQIKEKDFKTVNDKWDIKKPYLFYVGNAQPHKNLTQLIKVFKITREKYPELQLVLSGPEHVFWERIKKENNAEGIIFTGFVSEKELATLYKNAAVYVFPSLEEGFGIPLLEAMACGCPVAASDIGALKEIGGGAAVYFRPADENDMAEKVSQVLENRKLRESLVKDGRQRVNEFSWKKMAKETLEVYKNAI